ncbi:MAG: AraC family transcriptional regulator [Clostridia bacterium]|nr:AraC family transcriptional regulator [Clostridia bacterium]
MCNIAEKVGIYNYTYFCELFKKLSGVTPTEYRKSHKRFT